MTDPPSAPSGQPVVWIFGAGITGLTAAHELVERGFEVYVVEPADDPWETDLPAVGGVARTQWAMIPEGAPSDTAEGLSETVSMLRHPVLEFVGVIGAGSLRAQDRWEIAAFGRKLRECYGAQPPAVSMLVSSDLGTTDDGFNKAVQELLEALVACAKEAGFELQIDSTLDVYEQDTKRVRVTFVLPGRGVVPGEHGFRYFPGFYRHLFDTMRRTAVLSTGEDRYGPVVRSVFDNLVGTEATWLHVPTEPAAAETEGPSGKLIRFPRRPPRTPQALMAALQSFVNELGYASSDLTHLSLKLFQYMTTSKERRAAEHEDMTWWEFLQGEKFSPKCQAHMERGPEVLGAMTATESDVRTQGNMVTQLLLDQLVGRQVTDATLNGPTSLAWFDLWREYLIFRGVKFFRGTLVDFDLPDRDNPDHLSDVLLPRVAIADTILDPRCFTTAVRPHYFVLATPVTAMMGLAQFVRDNPERVVPRDKAGAVGTNLAARFLQQHDKLGATRAAAAEVGDFQALRTWQSAIEAEHQRDPVPARGAGPLRHLTGVQFFFPANIQFGQEHTLYMESGWRLSSISQVHFWHRRPTGTDGYRGIVSVDLGALFRPLGRAIPHRSPDDDTWAWNLPRATIAQEVFRDVADSIAVNTLSRRRRADHEAGGISGVIPDGFSPVHQSPPSVSVPAARPLKHRAAPMDRDPRSTAAPTPRAHDDLEPLCYHFDQNVIFDPGGKGITQNLSPYLINRPGEWALRPGVLPTDAAPQRGYTLQNARWVLAGTYMKTYTRLTTMEAANESARHAVNAILHDQSTLGDRCMIWDPEDYELPEFDDLKALDARLFRDGYPHMVEILGLDEIPWALLPNLAAPAKESP